MPAWQSEYLTVNGARLHYTRTGGDKQPLLMAHGFSDDGPCWTLVAEALEADYDIIMPDARGHGLSEVTEGRITPMHMVNDLKAIIATLGLHKPIMLAHSMGALMTLAFAGSYPVIPKAILLEDPPAWWYEGGFPLAKSPEEYIQAHEGLMALKTQPREALIARRHQESPTWSDAEVGYWADSKLRLSPSALQMFQPTIQTSLDWKMLSQQVTCPALLLTAHVSLGGLISDEGASALQKLIPQLQVAHIGGAGHSVHREQMHKYMTAVKAFLASLTD
ncbi:MAG: alpha/beta fold hydrolase [Anaerolineaceae bacterium]|nr:alpha/beta fold hydrolase [Anaerolineaceae bacterium]